MDNQATTNLSGNEMFLRAWVRTGSFEKGYANNPNDKGGETNHGITVKVARAYGYTGSMEDLPKTTACEIAKKQYWDVLRLDDIGALSEKIADELFDTGFLSGSSVAAIFLQRGLNTFNRSNRPTPDYDEVTEDGHLGAVTVHMLAIYLGLRKDIGEAVMLACLNCQQGNYLMEASRANKNDEEFEFGWFANRVVDKPAGVN